MRKESPLQKKEKKISWYEAKNNRIGSGEVWIAIAARFSGCFQCKDRLEKRVSTKRDGAVVSPRSFPRGGGGRGERVSTLLYFQQLVFLDDCVTFRSSRISIYFQPETSVPPFVLIHLLWMQRALVHLFPRNFVERATDRFSRRAIYLSTDLPRAPNGRRENLWCTQDRCLRSDGRTWKSWG